ncbi:hypothetical protein [Ensifer canadensis]
MFHARPQEKVSNPDARLEETCGSFDSKGFRLQGDIPTETATLHPYVKGNIWHGFNAGQRINFGVDAIVTKVGGGVVAKLSELTSLFTTADDTTNLGGDKTQVLDGNIGISMKW